VHGGAKLHYPEKKNRGRGVLSKSVRNKKDAKNRGRVVEKLKKKNIEQGGTAGLPPLLWEQVSEGKSPVVEVENDLRRAVRSTQKGESRTIETVKRGRTSR